MQDEPMHNGPMRPAARMNDESLNLSNLWTIIITFLLLVGADCTAIWLMK